MKDPLFDAQFRTSPAYELVVLDRATASERRLVEEQADPGAIYGLLRPREEGVPKVVDDRLALLLFTLREPGALPQFVRRDFEPQALEAWARGLVALGVLEIAEGSDFLHGEAALCALDRRAEHEGRTGGTTPTREPAGHLAQISLDALRTAAALPEPSRAESVLWLYRYGRQPRTPAWCACLPTPEAVETWLGIAGPLGKRLDRLGQRDRTEAWTAWSIRGRALPTEKLVYKLYVSPRIEDLPETLERLSQALPELDTIHWKIGRHLGHLLRPDKLVLYFADFDSLAAAGETLAHRLRGLGPHGVPFTAEIGLGGLLSWGADPPRSHSEAASTDPSAVLDTANGRSWRSWIAEELGTILHDLPALAAGPERPHWRRSLDVLASQGTVDPKTWRLDPVRWLARIGAERFPPRPTRAPRSPPSGDES